MSSAENQAGLAEWKKFQNGCSTPSSIGANTDSPDQDQIFADQKAAMIYVKAWEPGAVAGEERQGRRGCRLLHHARLCRRASRCR